MAVFFDGRVLPRHTESEHFYEDITDGKVYPSVTTKTSVLGKHYLKQWAVNQAVDLIERNIHLVDVSDPFATGTLMKEAREAHVSRLNEAAMWGTHGHDLVDNYVSKWIADGVRPAENILSFAEPDISNEGKCVALSATKFFDDHTLFPIVSEKKIVSKKYGYAGTLDSLWLAGEVYKEKVGDANCGHQWTEKRLDTINCWLCGREEKLSILLGDWKSSNQIFGYGSMGKHDYASQVMAYSRALTEMCKIRPKKHWVVRLDKQKPHYEIGYVTNPAKAFRLFLALSNVADNTRTEEPPLSPLISKPVIKL